MKKILLDDMILTKDTPTTAGSKMLCGYVSPFEATVASKLEKDYEIAGKAFVGEFAIDLVGETNYNNDKAYALGDACALVALDVNGAPRRVAAQNGLVYVKPTYGTVSRFGTVAIACSGESVGVMSRSAQDCLDVLTNIVGKDERDGTMHADDVCKGSVKAEKKIKKIAVLKLEADADVSNDMSALKAKMEKNGIELCEIEAGVISSANAAWNILMCAELCNNVSRFDGIKYGYRSQNYKTLDELYTNSRTEAFGELAKTAILYGSDVLSTKNYMAKYDKAMRVRRVISEAFAEIFKEYDAVMLPTCSKKSYTEADDVFVENKYTAPASVTGLPSVVIEGVQLIGPAFTDGSLLELAGIIEKEGK